MFVFEYIILFLGSVLFRLDLDFRSFIKEVGLELSDTKIGTGFQDALTPTKLNWLSFFCYFIILGTIITAFADRSISAGFICIVVSLLTLILSGVILNPPKKPRLLEKFYLKTLYSSMVNRYANFKKNNDNLRAEAIQTLIKKFEKSFYT